MSEQDNIIKEIEGREYKYGFTSDIETETIPRGLSEEVVRLISAKKGEPEWMTESRLRAYRHWLKMEPPTWAHLRIPEIDFQDIIYYAAPRVRPKLGSMDEVDPELKRTFDKLGIPLEEQMQLAGVAVDAVMDSVSVKTTFKETLSEKGIIFCSISEAIRDYPDLIKKYLGSVVPCTDNYYAALNAAVFSDGSFCYIPKGVRCPMELSTYFRINAEGTGQFERTLIVADEGAYVSYLEGCTAPRRDENQLHAAVVEIVVERDAEVKYSTVQNWYPGDKEGRRHLQLRHQARTVPPERPPVVDAGRDRLGDHVEISQLRAAGRQFGGGVLFGGDDQPFPAGRHRYQDDPHRPQHPQPDRLEGYFGRPERELLPRAGQGGAQRGGGAQLFAVRLAADRLRMRGAYLSRDRVQQPYGDRRARGHDFEDLRRTAFLLQPARPVDRGRRGTDRERIRQRGDGQAADGIRCRGTEIIIYQP